MEVKLNRTVADGSSKKIIPDLIVLWQTVVGGIYFLYFNLFIFSHQCQQTYLIIIIIIIILINYNNYIKINN